MRHGWWKLVPIKAVSVAAVVGSYTAEDVFAGEILIGGIGQNSDLAVIALGGLGGLGSLSQPRSAEGDPAYDRTELGGLTVHSLLVNSNAPKPRDGEVVTYSWLAPIGCEYPETEMRLDLLVSGKADGRVKLTCTPVFANGNGETQPLAPFTCFNARVPTDGITLRAARKTLTYKHEAGDDGPWTLTVTVKRDDTGDGGTLVAKYQVGCPDE